MDSKSINKIISKLDEHFDAEDALKKIESSALGGQDV